MDKTTIRIIRIILWVDITAPIGIITTYDVIRQEIDTNLSPLEKILPNWGLSVWISLFLLAIILGLIFEFYIKPKNDSEKSSPIQSQAENSSASFSAQVVNAPVTQQIFIAETKTETKQEFPLVDVDGVPAIKNGFLDNSGYTIPIGGGEPKRFYIPPANVMFAQVDFSNNPKHRISESTARNVRAIITYYEGNKLLGSTTGCWAGIDGMGDSEMVDLLFNGRPRTLYLAMRYELRHIESDSPLWMFGMETTHEYFLNRDRDFRFKLFDGENLKQFNIRVKLIGERVEQEYAFQLSYEGKAKDMRIIRLLELTSVIKL